MYHIHLLDDTLVVVNSVFDTGHSIVNKIDLEFFEKYDCIWGDASKRMNNIQNEPVDKVPTKEEVIVIVKALTGL